MRAPRKKTPPQRLRDEEVLAAIIAGAHFADRGVARGHWGVEFQVRRWCGGHALQFSDAPLPTGPCCAVGCGLLFAGVSVRSLPATHAFAKVHDVSVAYAQGVSDGFEYGARNLMRSTDRAYEREYNRGLAVGVAAAEVLLDQGSD